MISNQLIESIQEIQGNINQENNPTQETDEEKDLSVLYVQDKELLEDLVLDYRNLMTSIDVLKLNPDLKKEMVKQRAKFETTFVKIRCDILTSRAQIEQSIHELNFKEDLLKKKDHELEEANKLMEHFTSQIKMFSGK